MTRRERIRANEAAAARRRLVASPVLSASFTNEADRDAYVAKQLKAGRGVELRRVDTTFRDLDFTLYVVLVIEEASS